ncbi:MAG TPA: hypothetical protein VMJ30_07885 [Gemmatimonadales bacterium]|nr:hypothetical protein [Gemmatimonadales bacterium]
MTTPPPRDHSITLAEAMAHTRRFREANPSPKTEKAVMFWRGGGLDELMAQSGCAGIRIYFGRDPGGAGAMVVVGVDIRGGDLSGGPILEEGLPCPPWCPPSSPLAG